MSTAIPSTRPISMNLARLDQEYVRRFGVYTRLYFEDRSYTNLEQLEYSAALARVLREHGVLPGERVVMMLPNSPEFTASLHAIWTIGAIAVPIMPQWSALEAGHVLRDSGAVAALTVPALAPRLDEAAGRCGALLWLLSFGETGLPRARNIQPQIRVTPEIEEPVYRAPADPALLLYTAGTTGLPKGAIHTHGGIRAALQSVMLQKPGLPRGPMLQALPFSHSFGLLALHVANGMGMASVLMAHFDPVEAFRAIERHQVEYLPATPSMLWQLAHHPDRGRFNLSSLRRILSGGAALGEQVRAACMRSLNCRIEQAYGSSETLAVGAMYDETTTYRTGSAGQPPPGVEIAIVDEQGRPLGALHAGEICLASSHLTTGYWNDPDATGRAFTGKWFHTGDIGYLDREGFLYVTDRKTDMIVKGGENVSPREIEEVIAALPMVAEAAVLGVPDPLYGEEICAFLQLKPGAHATGEQIRAHVAGFVPSFKVPAYVIFHPALPKNASGKVSRREVRERLLPSAGLLRASESEISR
jgi:long-chain acyl-CoA synthetase